MLSFIKALQFLLCVCVGGGVQCNTMMIERWTN